jgi:2-oxoglutarate ferredoxin oxidoreductase subunit alpha
MQQSILVRFSGEQGQGVQSVAALAGQFFAGRGYHILAVNDYASRIKGGYSFSQIRISTGPARSVDRSPDFAFAVSPKQIARDLGSGSDRTVLFTERTKVKDELPETVLDAPLAELLEPLERTGTNVFYLGMLLALTGQPLEPLGALLADRFGRKGDAVVAANLAIARKGYAFAGSMEELLRPLAEPASPGPAVVKTGSQAVAIGAVAGGVRFHAGYPMAPSTAVMNTLARLSPKYGIVVEQAEDEISAITQALGASYAGVRAMTATSGGGLALMCETVSMAAISETPVVIVNVQRPGPATGLPTKTAQADLHMVLNLGHGEFSRAVLTPGTAEAAFHAGQKAFYLAEKYQVPVFILSDQHLGDSLWSSGPWKVEPKYHERFLKLESDLAEPAPYPRYSLAEGPVSPRALPGFSNDLVMADSHTHDERGHITEDAALSAAMVRKLLDKRTLMEADMAPPDTVLTDDADVLALSWGSSFGAVRDAVERLRSEGYAVGHVHFNEVYPLAESVVRAALPSTKRLIAVETNATGQLARLLRAEYGITCDDKVLKYDGRPFYTDELVAELKGRIDR